MWDYDYIQFVETSSISIIEYRADDSKRIWAIRTLRDTAIGLCDEFDDLLPKIESNSIVKGIYTRATKLDLKIKSIYNIHTDASRFKYDKKE